MKKINYYRWLYFIFLFAFILLFSTTSFALIPGDFGSAGGGPPDGCVDFEDLMIFAMAYGSTPPDANWNPLCDIYPDDKIDFEDLMIFAMHYGECEQATWTVMLYVDGDNNLEFWAWDILGMVESVGSSEEVNIVAQIDPYDDCAGTFRYHVTGVEEGSAYPIYPEDIVQSMTEQNMSDPAVLTNFIDWAGDNYPAEHYILILSDHGAGWREEDEIFKGIIWDDTTGGWEHIDIPELAQSLEDANINIDILGLDACNMQMIEVAYELGVEMTSPPNYLIASENTGWTGGLPYDELAGDLVSNPSMGQLAICETIVNGYIDNLSTTSLPATISAFHFNNDFLNDGLSIINSFANALLNSAYQEEISNARSTAQAYVLWDRPQYKDLYDFAQIIKNNVPDCQSESQAVMDLVNSVIVAEGHSGLGMDNSYGLSIYLIDSPGEYDSSYNSLQFAINTQWDEFLQTGEGVVTGVQITPVTRQVSTGLAPETLNDYQIANIDDGLKGETAHWIFVRWDAYYGVDGYRAYRNMNGGNYTMIFEWQDPPVGSGYAFYDSDISEGNTYSYYITAYGPDWETNPSEIASIEITAYTFLPACSLISPTDSSTITEINPVFSWSPVELDASDLPYGEIYSGETYLRIYDASTYETAWYIWFDDMTTSTATYDQNGNANPLIPGHTYRWYVDTYGYDNNGNWVASSDSENWEFYYGNMVADVDAYTVTYQGTSMEMFQAKLDQMVEEELIPDSFHLNELPPLTKGVVEHAIYVDWHSYPDATGYKVYRSVDGGSYNMVLDEPASGYTWYGFWDDEVFPGNTYSYYVTAYGDFGETNPSQTVTRDTFLPPCSLNSPPDGSIITEPNPTFNWNPAGVSTFPYDGTIYSGETYLRVYDSNTYDTFWIIWFEDMTTSTAIYNQDGYATPLVSDSAYTWYACSHGYDESSNLIAVSHSEDWYFGYGKPVVFNVNAYTITNAYQSSMSKFTDTITELEEEGKLPPTYYLNEPQELAKGVTGYEICVNWHSYYDATGYKVYRSVDGGSYNMVLDEPASGYTWYGFWDDEVFPGNTYSYYVTAYGDFGETNPSQTVTRDTFLPPCSLNSPPDGSIITEPNPTFNWNPAGVSTFPYDGTIYSGETYLRVYDSNTYDTFWIIWFEDMTTSTAIYNQDGYATPLVSDSAYTWYACSHGYDESSNLIAVSRSENWGFDY